MTELLILFFCLDAPDDEKKMNSFEKYTCKKNTY